MREYYDHPTLRQVRAISYFDGSMLAMQAGVAIETVYAALALHPILKEDAEKILVALSAHTDLRLSLKNVDIPLWEEQLMLWIVRISSPEPTNAQGETEDAYRLVYARNVAHAIALTREWFAQFASSAQSSFTACPEGLHVADIVISGHQQIEPER